MNPVSDPLADALRALPDFDPPNDGWARVEARLRPRRRSRRWLPLLMAAGVGAVAVMIGLQAPGPTPAPTTVATGTAETGTAPDAWALAAAAMALQAASDPYRPTDLDEAAVTVTATALLSTPDAEEEWL